MSQDQYSRRLTKIVPSYAHRKPIVSNCRSTFLMIYIFTKLCNTVGIILTYQGQTQNQYILSIMSYNKIIWGIIPKTQRGYFSKAESEQNRENITEDGKQYIQLIGRLNISCSSISSFCFLKCTKNKFYHTHKPVDLVGKISIMTSNYIFLICQNISIV